MTARITAVLAAALCAALAACAAAFRAEKRRHEREEEKIRREGAENARHAADIITEANRIKGEASTGSHSDDMRTMADRLHVYALGGE